jgi:hypothetical protein
VRLSAREAAPPGLLVDPRIGAGEVRERAHDQEQSDEDVPEHNLIMSLPFDQHQSALRECRSVALID